MREKQQYVTKRNELGELGRVVRKEEEKGRKTCRDNEMKTYK